MGLLQHLKMSLFSASLFVKSGLFSGLRSQAVPPSKIPGYGPATCKALASLYIVNCSLCETLCYVIVEL